MQRNENVSILESLKDSKEENKMLFFFSFFGNGEFTFISDISKGNCSSITKLSSPSSELVTAIAVSYWLKEEGSEKIVTFNNNI